VSYGPAAPVARNDVVLLSLTLNELATNATKYGAWSVPDGKVTVSWHSEAVTPKAAKDGLETEEHLEEKQRDELVIHWAEDGGPPVSAPSKKGFGSAVIQFAVERGLRGKMEANYAPQGIRYTIRLPTKLTGLRVDGADADQQYEMAE
jgi:two-component sensor histidine kinase